LDGTVHNEHLRCSNAEDNQSGIFASVDTRHYTLKAISEWYRVKILTNVITGSTEIGFYMITFKLSNQSRRSLLPEMK